MLRTIFILLFLLYSGSVKAAEDNAYQLSLEEVTRLALENNFDIQLAKYDIWISRQNEDVSKSIYDTVFNAEIKYQNNQNQPLSTITGTKTLDNDYNVGLSKKLPTGTKIGVDLKNNRHWTNSSFVTSSVSHDSIFGVSVVQDLGRNFFGLEDRGRIKITQLDIENVQFTSLDKIESFLAETQKAYWDLVLQKERILIQREMVEQAKRLYDLYQKQLADGVIEQAEAIASEANYKKRLNELLLVENEANAKENQLKFLLNLEQGVNLDVVELFNLTQRLVNEDEFVKMAFEHRRDYKNVQNEAKAKDIKLSIQKNKTWPEINLSASLERNGLGENFNESNENVIDEDNPHFSAGVSVEVPLANNKAKAELKAAELEKSRNLIRFKSIERQIITNIVNALQDVNIFYETAKNAELIAQLQSQKLVEEEKRFNLGRSNTDALIRFQEDVIQAKWEAAQAKYRYYAALIDLDQQANILLDKYWDAPL